MVTLIVSGFAMVNPSASAVKIISILTLEVRLVWYLPFPNEFSGLSLRLGLPLVVFELKNTTNEDTTIYDAYKQLTDRYKRDIPTLFYYNAFIVVRDGVNSLYGSFFSPIENFYAWRLVDGTSD